MAGVNITTSEEEAKLFCPKRVPAFFVKMKTYRQDSINIIKLKKKKKKKKKKT